LALNIFTALTVSRILYAPSACGDLLSSELSLMLNVSLVKTHKIINVADLLHNADNKLFTLMFTLIAPST